MKDVKRRKFITKFVKFSPAIGVGLLTYPAFKLIDAKRAESGEIRVKISSLSYEINSVNGFFIIKDGSGFKALSSSCTHLGCELKFNPLSQRFICPCHKSEFDLKGVVLKGPATRNLDIAKVSVEQNEVVVKL